MHAIKRPRSTPTKPTGRPRRPPAVAHSTRRRRRRVFVNAQRRSTDKPCMPSSAHAARLLSPRDAYAVCLPAPQSASNTSTPLIYA